jgi:IS5 family transposase
MSQMSFSDAEYAGKRKRTRREQFLAEMDQVVPWRALLSLIEPYYPLAGRGRHPYPLETMLRIHLLQNWYALSDPGMEEELYENTPMRAFARLCLNGPIPDETTILNFRHLLEANELAIEILRRVNAHLGRKGLMLKRGTIVDATFIEAPSSTKNETGKRDPEMDSGCKGEEWHFGMKAHIGVDAESGLVHSVFTTAANESDVVQTGELLHGKEEVVLGDSGYLGAQEHVSASQKRRVRWEISRRRGTVQKLKAQGETTLVEHEKFKARIRAKVEHPFRVIKCQFGLTKVRFKGLAKNTAHVVTLFALSNLWMARKRLLAMAGEVRAQ